jgi:error-prone DNA polymerase
MFDTLPAYAELHCLTNFTFLRGASHPEARRARGGTRHAALARRRMLARAWCSAHRGGA